MVIDLACGTTPICHVLIDGEPLPRLYLIQAKGAFIDTGAGDDLDSWDVYVDGKFVSQVPKLDAREQAKVWAKLILG